MYIFGYFFQKGHFKGFSKKEHIKKKSFLGGGGGGSDPPPAPPPPTAPEGLICRWDLLYVMQQQQNQKTLSFSYKFCYSFNT